MSSRISGCHRTSQAGRRMRSRGSRSKTEVRRPAAPEISFAQSYGRISTRDQHPEAQHDVLTAASCEEIFIDEVSDKVASLPELSKVLLVTNRLKDHLAGDQASTGMAAPSST
jgi:hypothetical protein